MGRTDKYYVGCSDIGIKGVWLIAIPHRYILSLTVTTRRHAQEQHMPGHDTGNVIDCPGDLVTDRKEKKSVRITR